jgi:predicted nucleic acid-binding protein
VSNRIVYADSSALVKLLVSEPETQSLRRELADEPVVVTSALAQVEVRRALRIQTRGSREGDEEARKLFAKCRFLQITRGIVELAGDLASAVLRSLDAIHLASALRVDPDLLITYDRKLAEAAVAARLRVLAPGRPAL